VVLWSLELCASAIFAVAQQSKTTFRSSSNLVLVDVVAVNAKNGLPDDALHRDDFQMFDDGQPASIATFDRGAQTRPLALWFVVLCNMRGYEKQGSGLFAGHVGLLQPALTSLNKQDTVAVAHWCDDGQSKVDLLPTNNVEQSTAALEQALTPRPDSDDHDRAGELALQSTLQLIVDATQPLVPERVPVVIFLYGDHSGMPRSEADHFIDELLQTSAIAYGLKDRRSPQLGRRESLLWGEQAAVANYIATQTGGQYFREDPESYSTGLEEILQQLHFRYELGFKPATLDGKRHSLRVELTDAVKNQRKGVRLRYRAAYVATSQGITQSAQGAKRAEDSTSSAGVAERSNTEPRK
jgi:hypothetical protein